MNYRRRKMIEQTAYQLLDDASMSTPPIDVEALAKVNDIDVIKYDLGDEISGVLVIKNDKVTIGFNATHYENRKRFTIAHELGHYFLNHQRNGLFIDKHKKNFSVFYRNTQSSTGELEQEVEANTFAAALLMPKHIVIEKVKQYGLDLSSSNEDDAEIQQLAKLFKVSKQAMSFRLGNIFYSY